MFGKQNKRRTQLTQTFQSQINQDRGSRFLMDKTLYKGIKQNDVSMIIDVNKDSGELTDKAPLSELKQLERIVIQMRFKYDQARTSITQLQSQLQKLRKTADNLKYQQTRLNQIVTGAKTSLENKQKQAEHVFAAVEARTYDMDIYKQMVATIKHDILMIKKRNFDKDIALKQERVRMKSLRNDDFRKTQLSYKCRDMLQSVQKAVINKQYQRISKLNTFYDALNRKHQNLSKQDQRGREIQQIMVKAMNQKLKDQKQWINLCRVNLFLKKFLKCKMERLITENSYAEGAYHKIRSNTDIKDCKDLIIRYLNRQKDYGTLLQSISQKEAKLQTLKYQNQQLQAKNLQLRHASDQISDSDHKGKSQESPLQKELSEVQQTLKQIKSKKQIMNKWASKIYSSFSGRSREQISKKYENKSLTELTKDVLCQIRKYLEHLLGDQNCYNSINNAFMSTRPSEKTFDDEMLNRNKRVKTTAVQDEYTEGDDRDAIYDGNSQVEFLHYNRRLTKKNDINRRFRIKTQLK